MVLASSHSTKVFGKFWQFLKWVKTLSDSLKGVRVSREKRGASNKKLIQPLENVSCRSKLYAKSCLVVNLSDVRTQKKSLVLKA
jgi:hypothetical protein